MNIKKSLQEIMDTALGHVLYNDAFEIREVDE